MIVEYATKREIAQASTWSSWQGRQIESLGFSTLPFEKDGISVTNVLLLAWSPGRIGCGRNRR
jgi:hypothetical protein